MKTPIPPDSAASTLESRMKALGVEESDVEESFVRSGGHGGQNVNKTSTCVLLIHKPTGMQVKCQTTRHQHQNRVLARELLIQKLEDRRREQLARQRQEAEKQRRKKRGRSAASKKRMLADKAHRGARKACRRSSGRESD